MEFFYLYRHPSSYIFRIRVPTDLQSNIGKAELRYSLQTGRIGEARYRARYMAAQVQTVFRKIRNGGKMAELTPEEINRLLRDFAKEVLNDFEDMKTYREKPASIDEIEGNAFSYDCLRDEMQEQLARADYRRAYRLVDNLLEEKGITLSRDSASYRKLCREMLKVQIDLHEELERREWGSYGGGSGGGPGHRPFIWETGEDTPKEQEKGKLLSEVIQHLIDENRSAGVWTEKSESSIVPALELFKEIVGDLPIKTIDRQMISDYHSKLKRLPPNREKDPRYRGKSIAQLLSMNPPPEKTVSEGTIRNSISRVVAIFNHAENHGFIDTNPAKGLKIGRKVKKENEKRAPFDRNDLDALFGSGDYIEDTMTKGYMFWTPVLALFTGARLNELAQLHLDDIKQADGVWFLDINDDGPDKQIKNLSSRRKIPLHPFITKELNFPGYVERLREDGNDRLFPDLSYSPKGGYSKSVSRWFNSAYKVKCGILREPGGPMKDFHSFRTTLATHLGQKRGVVDDRMLEQVLGHSSGSSTTFNTYVDAFSPAQLLEGVILHIDYGIDLSHLQRSRYAKRKTP